MVLRFLVLGMLSVAPMTGYALKKHFDQTINHFWSADRAQLYRTLAAIVADGLATVRVVPHASYPDRREHHITPEGRAALVEWLRSPVSSDGVREPFLARIFFAGNLEPHEVDAILADRRTNAERLIAELRAQQTSGAGDLAARLRRATLSNGIHHATAELAWLDETERSIHS